MNLPFPGWYIHNITTQKVYWATYFYQSILMGYIISTALSHDTVFYGLFLLICAQASIIKHRLIGLAGLKNKEVQHEQLVVIVRQHISIYR